MARELALAGRHALVTGASRGIGRAIALAFAEEGAQVCAVARSTADLDDLAAQVRAAGAECTCITADVTEADAAGRIVEQALASMGAIDVLVNNVGGNSVMTALETLRYAGWEKTLELNLNSVVRILQAAIPHLIATGNASIINVSSAAGERGAPFMSHYGAAKAALVSLTRSIAIELATKGVRANALVPGWIATDLTGFARKDDGVEQLVIGRVPMGRWGTSEEIAAGAVFLASDASSFMTGQSLILDGGLLANP